LANSELVVMLNQAFSDRAKLSKLLNISDEQMESRNDCTPSLHVPESPLSTACAKGSAVCVF